MSNTRKMSLPTLLCWLSLLAVVAVGASGCKSKKLMSIYDPTYVEQLEVETDSGELILPPTLNLNASDEFQVPEKINAQINEYEQIFSIFSDNRIFTFRSDGEGRYWLMARVAPARIWLGLKEFFRVEGLEIDYENFALGEMRTRWAENLARNRYADAVFHHADRYQIRVLPSEQEGWVDVHFRHQGLIRDLRLIDDESERSGDQADKDSKSKKTKKSRKSSRRDEVLDSYLRTRRARWQPSPSEPSLALEMLTRAAIFLGSPPKEAQQLQRKHVTGVLGRIYLERSEFGDISLVVGDNILRTYFFLERILTTSPQFSGISGKEGPEKLLFSIQDYQKLDPALPAQLYLYFIRSGEYVKLLLFDQQDNIINPILAENVFRLLAEGLRPKYIQADLDNIELLDTRSLSPSPDSK